MNQYRVIDLQTETVDPSPLIIGASTPEQAAELVLGVQLMRGGAKADLRARVYWQNPGQPITMVRLYTKAVHRI